MSKIIKNFFKTLITVIIMLVVFTNLYHDAGEADAFNKIIENPSFLILPIAAMIITTILYLLIYSKKYLLRKNKEIL